jgi:hypothetical protein
MTKSKQSNKEVKKQPLLNPKEKKAAKLARKHAGEVVPFLPARRLPRRANRSTLSFDPSATGLDRAAAGLPSRRRVTEPRVGRVYAALSAHGQRCPPAPADGAGLRRDSCRGCGIPGP